MAGLKKWALTLVVAAWLGSGAPQAALFDRGGGLIYDDVLDITWLADANYAKTSGYDSDGRMNWSTANTWAANLVYEGYDDWRLPSALNQDGSGPCQGYNCSSSEMGYMFYNNLGATAYYSVLLGTNTVNLALFSNLKSYVYWSGTMDALGSVNHPSNFMTEFGFQYLNLPSYESYAWAVRDGDIAVAAPIPEPEVYAMLLAGLGLLSAVAKRRRPSLGAA